MTRRRLAIAAVLAVAGCAADVGPAELVAGAEACRFCRMTVSDASFAAQLVVPGEEPMFFDDVGCLAAFLRERPSARPAVAFVSTYDTRAWIPAGLAVYAHVPSVDTPMGSHVLAFAAAAGRAAALAGREHRPMDAADLFGPVPAREEGR